MQKVPKHIIIWGLVLLLSVFTPGVSFFKWMCLCSGKQNISFVAYENPCDTNQASTVSAGDCCQIKKKKKSCCKHSNEHQQTVSVATSQDHYSCCHKEVQTLKLDDQSVNRFSTDVKPLAMQVFILPMVFSFLIHQLQVIDYQVFSVIPPPLLSLPTGKEICLSIHRLRN